MEKKVRHHQLRKAELIPSASGLCLKLRAVFLQSPKTKDLGFSDSEERSNRDKWSGLQLERTGRK